MLFVKATREGRLGEPTASGYIVDPYVSFVALPSKKALHKFVKLINFKNSKSCYAEVLDVGPWNINDDAYVFQPKSFGYGTGSVEVRPLAEVNISVGKKGTNGAGIDLGERVWNTLEMLDNCQIGWEFLTL